MALIELQLFILAVRWLASSYNQQIDIEGYDMEWAKMYNQPFENKIAFAAFRMLLQYQSGSFVKSFASII